MSLQNTTSSHTPRADPLAQSKIQRAFKDFERLVTTDDARNFHSTTLEHVRQQALEVERQLAARQSLCNLRRLQPLFESLEHYSGVTEVLCNGTPYLPWIWAPIKLILRLAADYVSAFQQLIDAYIEIADALPRFDQLSVVFNQSPNFQQILALYYVDILSFHREAYKFLRRPAWKLFFMSSWGRFRRQFNVLIQDLRRHSDLVDKEASVQAIVEAERWRDTEKQRIIDIQKEKAFEEYRSTLRWIHIDELEQVNRLDSLANSGHSGTCDWALKNQKIKAWVPRHGDLFFLWLTGKPGSGKSVLSAQIVRFLLADKRPDKPIVLYHFFTYAERSGDDSGYIYRSLLSQLLQENDDLLRYVYEEYILRRKPASTATVKDILSKLISSISNTPSLPADVRIIVDGIDECRQQAQVGILQDLIGFVSSDTSRTTCKLLVSSRDTQRISRILRKKNTLSLDQERHAISAAIRSFVNSELKNIRTELMYLDLDDNLLTEIQNCIVEKSDGMFLWVQLVLQMLHFNVYNVQAIKAAVEKLPKDLTEFYRTLLLRLQKELPNEEIKRAYRIFHWIAHVKRPLRKFELLSAIEFHPENTSIRRHALPCEEVFTICKPFIQDNFDGTLSFVHFTVHEFFTQPGSGPVLQPARGHRDLALSCIMYYLHFGLPLLDSGVSTEEQVIEVVKGYHGLQPYAHEYLIEHLSMVGRYRDALSPSDLQKLMISFDQLCSNVDTVRTSLGLPMSPQDRVGTTIPAGLVYLGENQAMRDFILEELSNRENIRQTLETGPSPSEMPTRSTVFGKIFAQHEKLINSILSLEHLTGVRNDILAKVQQQYGRYGFRCRYPDCTHIANEFGSDQLRRQHELAYHSARLNCTDPDCTYGLTFRDKKDLNAHIRKHHTRDSISVIPSSVRRYRRETTILNSPRGREEGRSEVSSEVLQAYEAQLRLLEKENQRRLLMNKFSNNLLPLSPELQSRILPEQQASRQQQLELIQKQELDNLLDSTSKLKFLRAKDQPVAEIKSLRAGGKEGVRVVDTIEPDSAMTKPLPDIGYGKLPTSYWSVCEQQNFPVLLAHFGRNFEGISNFMKTKTTVMVKNYFQRGVNSDHKEYEEIVQIAEEKKMRGEPTGRLPVPSVAPQLQQQQQNEVHPPTYSVSSPRSDSIEQTEYVSVSLPSVLLREETPELNRQPKIAYFSADQNRSVSQQPLSQSQPYPDYQRYSSVPAPRSGSVSYEQVAIDPRGQQYQQVDSPASHISVASGPSANKVQPSLQEYRSTGITKEEVREMDQVEFPEGVLRIGFNINYSLPKNVKTWGQLKEFVAQNPNLFAELDLTTLHTFQELHMKALERLHPKQTLTGNQIN